MVDYWQLVTAELFLLNGITGNCSVQAWLTIGHVELALLELIGLD